jgi:AmmeMemoRadiSam system protein B
MSRCIGPNVAGTWYPAGAVDLGEQLDGFLADADRARGPEPGRSARVAALIAPHAGFVYSGDVAAKGFLAIRGGSYRRVVLIGPSHYAAFEGAALPSAAAYRTPLGEVPFDTEALRSLRGSACVRESDAPFDREHSLEAEIPFLQRCLPEGWRLLPVLVGMLGPATAARDVADALRPCIDGDTLVVVSSDFTHYGPRFDYVPFDRDVPSRLERLDRDAVDLILAWDREGFERYVRRTGATICGRNPIRVMLDLFPEALPGKLAAYDTSGRMTGDWGHSVSYASLVFRESRWTS